MTARVLARRQRLLLWLAAAALVLRAAMPRLASASASWQGVPLAEVCSVYGVATRAVDAAHARVSSEDRRDGSRTGSAHDPDRCALAGVAFLGVPPSVLDAGGFARAADGGRAMTAVAPTLVDAQAGWRARLLHAPPRLG
jgi:hypothetical protein